MLLCCAQVSFAKPPAQLTILAINDVYRLDNLAQVRTLRARLEQQYGKVLLLHAGDFLFPSLLSRRFDGEQMISVLNHLDGDGAAFDPLMFITFGNHEFGKNRLRDAPMLQSRIRESQFTWLNANVVFKDVISAEQMLPHKLIEIDGVKIGLIGGVTDIRKAQYIRRYAPIEEVFRQGIVQLRQQGAGFVIALTHLTMQEDRKLLQNLGDAGPDLVIGGHEHERQQAEVSGRYVIKSDADANTVAVIRVEMPDEGTNQVAFHYEYLPGDVPADPTVAALIHYWKTRFDSEYCASHSEIAGCTRRALGKTNTELVGEELTIRRFETNLGNWLADEARSAFADQGAQIAFLNSGGMRLNQNLPAGTRITRQHLDTLFSYPTPLVMIRLTGEQLQQVLDHSVSDWSGNGHWLQVSGLAFRHDPVAGLASDLHLIGPDGRLTPIKPQDQIIAVVNDFLIDSKGNKDGYRMLNETLLVNPGVPRPDLKALVIERLKRAGVNGISPKRDGRICNVQASSHCLIGKP